MSLPGADDRGGDEPAGPDGQGNRGSDRQPGEAAGGVTIVRDEEAGLVRVEIPLCDGRASWADVLSALARYKGFDDRALADIIPPRTVDLCGATGRVLLASMNLVMAPRMRFEVAPGREGKPDRFAVTVDRVGLLSSKRNMKRLLRKGLLGAFRLPKRDFGLEIDKNWERTPSAKRLVILIHGLDSTPDQLSGILEVIRKAGLPSGRFCYPNDQAIEDSARLLSRELEKLRRDHPGRRVALLTHSMGGLVAREAIENPELDPGNVDRLVMVAPPTHGSVLAHFAFGLEVWEHAVKNRDSRFVEDLFAAIEDGLGEASEDLEPGSPFLRRLNGRRRHPGVAYTIFLGTGAPLDKQALIDMKTALEKAGARNRFVRFFGAKLGTYLSDLEEIVWGKGDGAVAVKRGRLEGVADTMVLDFDHLTLFRDPSVFGSRRLRDEILRRLQESP